MTSSNTVSQGNGIRTLFITLFVSAVGFLFIFVQTSQNEYWILPKNFVKLGNVGKKPFLPPNMKSHHNRSVEKSGIGQENFLPPKIKPYDSLKKYKSTILFWTFNYLTKQLGMTENPTTQFECGIYECTVTRDRSKLNESHAILFNVRVAKADDLPEKLPWQRWVMQTRESPMHEKIPKFFDGKADWTFDYTQKSDIPWAWGFTIPRGQYHKLPFDDESLLDPASDHYIHIKNTWKDRIFEKTTDEIMSVKKKKTLWIVSNCSVKERNEYVRQLMMNGLVVEKYGRCSKRFPCDRGTECEQKIFLEYKFYLAFENSHCDDYITEKLWKSLYNGMLPIVMGPSIENYRKLLPPDSFLHVQNFSSPAALAQYLKYLDNNNEAYLKYHAWRKDFEVVFTNENTFLWMCDMCKKVHGPRKPAYKNISKEFTPGVACVNHQVNTG